jgi:hypothetical protein
VTSMTFIQLHHELASNTSLSARTLPSASVQASFSTASPLFPASPPNPSCLTKHALPPSSSAMVIVVGRRGDSSDVGSGKR